MTSPHRKHRGIATQMYAAAWFRDHSFPYAAGYDNPEQDDR
jgi:hypothetical protein